MAGRAGRLREGTPMLEFESVRIQFPSDTNIIVGQSHFIKTVEDIYEAVVCTVPQVKFGVAFNEASGPCLIRSEGNDEALKQVAAGNAQSIGAGHVFVLVIRNAYPINLLKALRAVDEICSIFCATANPVDVLVAVTNRGRGIIGVIDGSPPAGIEQDTDIADRHRLLRALGYKL